VAEGCVLEAWPSLAEERQQACQRDQIVVVSLRKLKHVSHGSQQKTCQLTTLFLFLGQVTLREIIKIV
jgi:hypothetical protein